MKGFALPIDSQTPPSLLLLSSV